MGEVEPEQAPSASEEIAKALASRPPSASEEISRALASRPPSASAEIAKAMGYAAEEELPSADTPVAPSPASRPTAIPNPTTTSLPNVSDLARQHLAKMAGEPVPQPTALESLVAKDPRSVGQRLSETAKQVGDLPFAAMEALSGKEAQAPNPQGPPLPGYIQSGMETAAGLASPQNLLIAAGLVVVPELTLPLMAYFTAQQATPEAVAGYKADIGALNAAWQTHDWDRVGYWASKIGGQALVAALGVAGLRHGAEGFSRVADPAGADIAQRQRGWPAVTKPLTQDPLLGGDEWSVETPKPHEQPATVEGLARSTELIKESREATQVRRAVLTQAGDAVVPNVPMSPEALAAVEDKLGRMGADPSDPQSIAKTVSDSLGLPTPKVEIGDVPVAQTKRTGAKVTITLPQDADAGTLVHELEHQAAAAGLKEAPPEGDDNATAAKFLQTAPETPPVDAKAAKMAFPSVKDQAKIAADSLREGGATLALKAARVQAAIGAEEKYFDSRPLEEGAQFQILAETAADQGSTRLNNLRDTIGKLFDDRVAQVRALGSTLGKNWLESVIQDYFPHIWADPEAASRFYASRRQLLGESGWLKERTHEDITSGLAAGLELAETNPVRVAAMRMAQIDKFLEGHRNFQEMKELDIAKFFKIGAEPGMGPPADWRQMPRPWGEVRYQDPETGQLSISGHWYAPAEVVDVYDRYLSPGLASMKWAPGRSVFEAWRQAGNLLNQAQLGISAFHVGTTVINTAANQASLGIGQLGRAIPAGDIGLAARGAGNLLMGTFGAPISAGRTLWEGIKFAREYLGDGPITPDVEDMLMAGQRLNMDPYYSNQVAGAILGSWREGLSGFAKETAGKLGQAWTQGDADVVLRKLPGALLEVAAKPLMEWFVPRMKAGAVVLGARDIVEQLGPVDREVLRYHLGRYGDSIDNRIGQLVRDNLFWNRAVLDLTTQSMRSLGWNFGSSREGFGALYDTATIPGRVAAQRRLQAASDGKTIDLKPGEYSLGGLQGEAGMVIPVKERPVERLIDPLMTHRMKYAMAYPITVGVMGGMLLYLMRGRGPDKPEEYFNLPTGKTNPDGTAASVSLPGYHNDYFAFKHDPILTIANKAHPLLSAVSQMLRNRDYYNRQIVDPQDDALSKGMQVGAWILGQFKPFSIQGVERAQEEGSPPALQYGSYLGVKPVPGYRLDSPMQAVMRLYEDASRSQLPISEQRWERNQGVQAARKAFLEGGAEAANSEIMRQINDGKIASGDIPRLRSEFRYTPNQRRFKRMPVEWQARAMDVASPDEKEEVSRFFQRQLSRIHQSRSEAERQVIERHLDDGSDE